jgi:hypothetical protein
VESSQASGGNITQFDSFYVQITGYVRPWWMNLKLQFWNSMKYEFKKISRCRLSQNSNRRGWFDLISFSVFRTFFLWPPFIFVSPVSCHWPGMGSDTCGILDQSCASSQVGWARELVPAVLPSCDLFCQRGLLRLAGVAGGFLKSSFCGLLPMKQHLFKVGLIWLDSKLGQLERASVGEFGFSCIYNSVGMTRTHTRPVAVFNIIECFWSVVW